MLTSQLIEATKPGAREIWLSDDHGLRGTGRLLLRITPGGTRRFHFRYSRSERRRTIPLGPYSPTAIEGYLTLQQARTLARKYATSLHLGMKLGSEFPYEGFVREAIQSHLQSAGFLSAADGPLPLLCRHPKTGEAWHVMAMGMTPQIAPDLGAGIGQLVQAMSDPGIRYAIAVPETPAFRTQVSKVSDWVVNRLGLHWLFVSPDGSVQHLPPSANP